MINTAKGNEFAVYRNKAEGPNAPIEDELIYLLDPLNRDDVSLLTFNDNGEAMPLNPMKMRGIINGQSIRSTYWI